MNGRDEAYKRGYLEGFYFVPYNTKGMNKDWCGWYSQGYKKGVFHRLITKEVKVTQK